MPKLLFVRSDLIDSILKILEQDSEEEIQKHKVSNENGTDKEEYSQDLLVRMR